MSSSDQAVMWTTLIPIMTKYGVEFAYQLWANIKSNKEPTQEDWDKLLAMSQKTYSDYIEEAIKRAHPGAQP